MTDRTEIHFQADELVEDTKIYIVIHGMRKHLWRVWIGGLLLRLAQRIILMDVIIMRKEKDRLVCPEGYACGFTEPYGFVPECGCPLHDPDDDCPNEKESDDRTD